MHIFWNKNVKITSVSGAPPRTPVFLRRLSGSTPRPTRYYSCLLLQDVEFISSTKCILFPSKKNKITVNVLLLLLLQLSHLFFISNCLVFIDGGHKNISCPRTQDILATPLLNSFGK